MKRTKPGLGWRHLGGSVWEHAANSVRIHVGGLVFENAGRVESIGRCLWANQWPISAEWDRHTRIAGGSRKRGLMTLALEIAKGDES